MIAFKRGLLNGVGLSANVRRLSFLQQVIDVRKQVGSGIIHCCWLKNLTTGSV